MRSAQTLCETEKTASAAMRCFLMSDVRGEDRRQAALLRAAIEDEVSADVLVRVTDALRTTS